MVKKFTDPQGVVHRIEHTEEDQKKYHQLLNDSNALDFFVLLSSMSEGASVSLWDTFPKGEITKSKAKAKATNLKHRGEKDFEQYLDQITERIISGDELGLIEIAEEISVDAKRMLFNRLSNEHQTMAREMLNAPE